MRRTLWLMGVGCVLFVLAHQVGLAVLFGVTWVVLYAGRRLLVGRR